MDDMYRLVDGKMCRISDEELTSATLWRDLYYQSCDDRRRDDEDFARWRVERERDTKIRVLMGIVAGVMIGTLLAWFWWAR